MIIWSWHTHSEKKIYKYYHLLFCLMQMQRNQHLRSATVHFLSLLSVIVNLYNFRKKKINTFEDIFYICCCLGNKEKIRTDRSIRYFKWYIAIQIGHAIDITGKVSVVSSVVNFLSQTSVKRSKFPALQGFSFFFWISMSSG